MTLLRVQPHHKPKFFPPSKDIPVLCLTILFYDLDRAHDLVPSLVCGDFWHCLTELLVFQKA